jgi:putative PIN family toxin of toxin-antitoxin system
MVLQKTFLKGGVNIQAVLDTNILFSGLYSINGASYQILRAITLKKIEPVLSVALLFEYEDVLKRNSKKLGFTNNEIDSFLDNMCKLGSFKKIHYLWRPFLPDPKDDHVLELAVAAHVNVITTFNYKDFKGSEAFGVNVIGPKQLLEEIKWER